jgi:hypothetical protein
MSACHSSMRRAARDLLGVILATALVIACQPPGGGPAAAITAMNIDSMPAETVLARAAAQTYDSSPAVAETATIVEGGRSAVIAFDPVADGRQRSVEDLRNGFFVARWRRVGDSVRYPMRSARGYVWMDSIGGVGWRVRYYSSDPSQGYSNSDALAVEDSEQKDDHPQPRSPVVADSVGPFHCYYTDSRWVCPRFTFLTQERVAAGYASRSR